MTQYDSPSDHRYSSHPSEWPMMEVNVAYWADSQTGVSTIIYITVTDKWI